MANEADTVGIVRWRGIVLRRIASYCTVLHGFRRAEATMPISARRVPRALPIQATLRI